MNHITQSTLGQIRDLASFEFNSPFSDLSLNYLTSGKYSVGIILPVGYSERVPTAVRNLQRLVDESELETCPGAIRSVVVVNFGLSEEELLPIENELSRLRGSGRLCEVLECERHSAARSFNTGAQFRAASEAIPDFVMKVDDDAAFDTGTFSDLIAAAGTRNNHLTAPVYYRPSSPVDYTDDQVLANMSFDIGFRKKWPNGLHANDWVGIPPYTSERGKINLGTLMLGFDTSHAKSPTPITPIESGMTLSGTLIRALLETSNGQQVFPEEGLGSEGLRLLTVVSGTSVPIHSGVVKSVVYDRPTVGGQPYEWGVGDAKLVMNLSEMGLLPDGIAAVGNDQEGQIYSRRVAFNRPVVLRGIERLERIVAVLEDHLNPSDYSVDVNSIRHGMVAQAKEVLNAVNSTSDSPHYWGAYEKNQPNLWIDQEYMRGTIEYMAGVYNTFEQFKTPMSLF